MDSSLVVWVSGGAVMMIVTQLGGMKMILTNQTHKPYRKDKYFKIGSYTLQYIHYYPTYAAEVSYGWLFVRKEGLLDIYFGKHVFAFILRKNWYYDVG